MPHWKRLALALTLVVMAAHGLPGTVVLAQQDPAQIQPNPDAVLMAVYLKQTQEMNLDQMSAAIRGGGFWKVFPPEGVKIAGWYILMGIGHLVLLEVPPAKVRELNRSLESAAYGIFRVEVHPGYDFLPVVKVLKERYGQ